MNILGGGDACTFHWIPVGICDLKKGKNPLFNSFFKSVFAPRFFVSSQMKDPNR